MLLHIPKISGRKFLCQGHNSIVSVGKKDLMMWISETYCFETMGAAFVSNRILDLAKMGEPQMVELELQGVFRIKEMSPFLPCRNLPVSWVEAQA